jgi:hypothetical protein
VAIVPASSRGTDPSAAVDSVFGRTGVVVAATNDYTAAQVGALPGAVLYDSGVLAAPAATLDAAGLSAAWVDLIILLLLRGTNAATSTGVLLTLNNDGGANYDTQEMKGQGNVVSAALVNAATSAQFSGVAAANAPANAADVAEIVIPSYASTTFQKAILWRQSLKLSVAAFGLASQQDIAFWRSTAAVNRVTIAPAVGSWDTGSRMRILGRG